MSHPRPAAEIQSLAESPILSGDRCGLKIEKYVHGFIGLWTLDSQLWTASFRLSSGLHGYSSVLSPPRRFLLACIVAFTALTVLSLARADEFSELCADRAAIERIYHTHRLATTQSFEETMPAALIAQLTRADLHKEAVLQRAYGVTITPELVAAEVQRIDASTRAPEVLAEIKAALGNDSARFARTLARPLLVERTLRARFENDDSLHATQRRAAEQARADLLAQKPLPDLHETTWQLTPRPSDDLPAPAAPSAPAKVASHAGLYSNEATAQIAQTLGAPAETKDQKFYFEDLDPELQNILRAQLKKTGDVSAVIETPGGFLVFLAQEKTDTTLRVASISLAKRSYETWLTEHSHP